MGTELKDNATHEDIQKYVDDLVANVQKDQQGDGEPKQEKSDSEKAASDSDKPTGDMTAEQPSGSDESAESPPKDDGEETGEENVIDDKLKAEATAYGITEKDLEQFTSREELERALRLFDRSVMEAGRKAMAEGATENKPETGKLPVEQDKTEAKEEHTPPPDGRYEVTLDKNVYDEEIIGEFTRMRDHYEERLRGLEEHFLEAQAKAEEQVFDRLVDGLEHSDLFGVTGKENDQQLENRRNLLVAVKQWQVGLEQFGRAGDMDEQMIRNMARMQFAEQFDKRLIKNHTRRISKQSNGRQGGGATRPTEQPMDIREEMRQLYKELDQAG